MASSPATCSKSVLFTSKFTDFLGRGELSASQMQLAKFLRSLQKLADEVTSFKRLRRVTFVSSIPKSCLIVSPQRLGFLCQSSEFELVAALFYL